jgi:hypothetical protein
MKKYPLGNVITLYVGIMDAAAAAVKAVPSV